MTQSKYCESFVVIWGRLCGCVLRFIWGCKMQAALSKDHRQAALSECIVCRLAKPN